jgi:hypothetical protein
MPPLDGSPGAAWRTPRVTELPLRLEPVSPDPFNDDSVTRADPPDPDAHARQRARVIASLVAVPDPNGTATCPSGVSRGDGR